MSKYEIVFVDIDDTLNPSNGKISQRTKDVIKRVKEKGIKVVVNTGRSAQYAVNKSIEGNLSEYTISSNGAEIYDYVNKKKIFTKPIPKESIKPVYDYCKQTGMTLILNTIEKRYINVKDYSYNSEPAEYFESIDEVLNNNEINQFIILSSNFDRMLVIPSLFKEKLPELKAVHSSVNLVEGNRVPGKEYYHDFVLENTAKGTGIVELLDYLNIDSDKAVAIGNGYDDLPMFDVVGTSIAVDNANDMLKEKANYITASSKDDGVAEILEKLILNEESDLNEV